MTINRKKKSKNKRIRLLYRRLKRISVAIINNPFILINAILYLVTNGPKQFINKIRLFEKKIQYIKIKDPTNFKQILEILLKIILIFPVIIFRAIFALIYFFVTIVYFIFIKLFYFFSYPFKEEISISQKKIDGFSIAMLTWNKKELTYDDLKILVKVLEEENLDIPYEIVVIDNGSTDGTVKFLQSKIDLKNKIKIIPLDRNYGFSKSYNLALKRTKYNWVYIMNNDMIVQKNTFKALIKSFEKYNGENIFSFTSQIFFFDPKKKREESGKTYVRFNQGYLDVAHEVDPRFLEKESNTLYFGGGSTLINKELFYALGGFEENIIKPYYSEDLDLGYRAWKFGFKNIYVPSSKIIHHHRATNKDYRLVDYIIKRNALFMILKNFSDTKFIFNHLIFYPLRMIIRQDFFLYGLEAISRMHLFIGYKIKTLLLKEINTDKEILYQQYL